MGRKSPPIKPYYLSKKGRRWKNINLLNLAVLLFNLAKADRDPEIGGGDIRESLEHVLKRLNFYIFIDPADIENLLWASNMLDENGEFWDAKGRSFDEFVRGVVKRGVFDKTYNEITWEKKENKNDNGTTNSGGDAIKFVSVSTDINTAEGLDEPDPHPTGDGDGGEHSP